MALVMAIGITTVLAIAGTTAIAYSTSSATQATQSAPRQSTFALAEAGINNAMAVLNLPTNNALDPDTLPQVHDQRKEVQRRGRATRTSVSTWMRSTINGGTAELVRHARPQGCALVRDLDRRSQQTRSVPAQAGVPRTLEATVTVMPDDYAAAQQPGLELPLRGPHRQHLRPVAEQQHHRLLADVRRRQPLPEPERPARPVDGDRRREPRRLEQRGGRR